MHLNIFPNDKTQTESVRLYTRIAHSTSLNIKYEK